MAELASALLECRDITAAYGRTKALHGVSLRIDAGEIVAVIGANGAGKTTLMRTIMGFLRPDGGRVLHHGEDVSRAKPHQMARRHVAYVPEGRELFASLSVRENLRMGLMSRDRKAPGSDDLDEAFSVFPVLADRQEQAAGTLSGGEQQMLAMARALISRPELCLMDEPSLGLAPRLQEQIFQLIETFRSQHVSVLLVEQNARRALAIADRAYVLEVGRTVATATGAELAQDPRIEMAYLGHRTASATAPTLEP